MLAYISEVEDIHTVYYSIYIRKIWIDLVEIADL